MRPRCGPGPAGQKKYVLGAFTGQYSLLFLGARSLEILPRLRHPCRSFRGVVVSDRYVNYVRHEAHCYIAC